MSADAVRLREVHVRRGARAVLAGVDFSVARGEVVALMGSSGSGKTTLLRAIAALDRFDQGTIEIDGIMVSSGPVPPATVRQLRQKIGIVFQFHCLFEHLPALANVCLAPLHVRGTLPTDAERHAIDLLTTLGVAHRAHALPRELSGGEAQRVAIARALAMDPPVLLMDEPTASLDADRRAELADLIRRLVGRNRTLIVATHDEDFARAAATRIVNLHKGRIR
jgi:ABC-type polar amino acid transport system ATPase subunit